MSRLAIQGGKPAVEKGILPSWPKVTAADEEAVLTALRAGDYTVLNQNGSALELERRWAGYVGSEHCVTVANGTAAITLALAALGIGFGDEVIVPALTFIAPALAAMHIGAVPVFADVGPRSFNIDPDALRSVISSRTKAIVVVHLHGLPADMDEILSIAAEHDLVVIEDAAQSHGAQYKGRMTGTLADVGTFSLSISKNLPTCGEGGLVVTDNRETAERVRMLRQFGETLIPGKIRKYQHHDVGWNNKMNGINCAFTLSQLEHLEKYSKVRERQVRDFLKRLSKLPGLVCPECPEDRTHAWHILRFRLDARQAGLKEISNGSFRVALQRVLQAEGCPVREYQTMPLPAQPVYSTHKDSWAKPILSGRDKMFDPGKVPVSCAITEDSFVLQKIHVAPDTGPVLARCAEAFEKAFRHLDFVADLARAKPFTAPWARHQPEVV